MPLISIIKCLFTCQANFGIETNYVY